METIETDETEVSGSDVGRTKYDGVLGHRWQDAPENPPSLTRKNMDRLPSAAADTGQKRLELIAWTPAVGP